MSIALERPPAAGTAYRGDALKSKAEGSKARAPAGGSAGLAAHLDILPDPSFLLDADGRIRLANAAARKRLGRVAERIAPGASFCELWEPSARSMAQAIVGLAARETGRFDAALDGSAAAYDVALSPTHENGVLLAVCRDVTGLAAPAEAPKPARPEPAAAPASSGADLDQAPNHAPDHAPDHAEGIAEDTFREIDHRLRNLFAMVPSLVKLSMRKGGDVNIVHKAITGRIAALSRANSLTLQHAGRTEGVSVDDLIAVVLDRGPGDERIVSSGPPVRLATRAYNAVALTLHELATNALTHGALAEQKGRVRIAWAVEDEARTGALPDGATGVLRLLWTETGGPRIEGEPRQKGFGTSTVDKLIASQGGTIEREWRRHGLNVTIDLPLYDLGAEPRYAKPLQPPPRPKVDAGRRAANAMQSSSDPLPEHATPIDTDARREAALEAQIVEQLDRIIAGTHH